MTELLALQGAHYGWADASATHKGSVCIGAGLEAMISVS